MLRTRVITALVMMAILLPSMFYLSQANWALLVAAFTGIGAWEWGGLLLWKEKNKRLLGVVVAFLCAGISIAFPEVIGAGDLTSFGSNWVILAYLLATIFWCLFIPLWLRKRWMLGSGVAGMLTGLIVLIPTWLALVQLRIPGPGILLALFAVVWMADVAAYFSGKRFGRNKLAPNISPGKTWEGAIGAVIGVVIYGICIRFATGYAPMPLLPWVIALVFITAISIIGDLYESMLKRQAGIKDSSNVLPGHGGVLDRIDSLTSTMPIIALLWLVTQGAQ